MKCEKCLKDYPSRHYFKTKSICGECYDNLFPEEQAAAKRPPKIHTMTTTAFTLDGYRIIKSFGVVRGIIVRSRSVFGTIGA